MPLRQELKRAALYVMQGQDTNLAPAANPDSVLIADDRNVTIEVWNTAGGSDFDSGTVTVYKKSLDGNWVPLFTFTAPGYQYWERGSLPVELTAGLAGSLGSANASVTISP